MTLSAGAGELLRSVRAREPMTRAEVGELTGWARVTVNARIDELLEAGLLCSAGSLGGARGRPAARFQFDPSRGDLLVADIGASAARLARCDLAGRVLDHTRIPLHIGDGPDVILGSVTAGLDRLRGPSDPPLWGVGVSLPGPIEQPAGRVVSPPIMTGWDGVAVPELLGPVFGAPVLVENDANAMAWGEHRSGSPRDLLFVKVGTGVGAGIVANGQILRGARGGAGDLGHTFAELDSAPAGASPPLCMCGKLGCVEAYVGGWAITRDLAADGEAAGSLDDVLKLLKAGNPHAVRRIRDAGRVLGAGIAHAVSLLNPSEIIIGGQLAVADEHLLSGVRQQIAVHSLPLATHDLRIRVSRLGDQAGVVGLADALATWVLDETHLPEILARLDAAPSAS